MRASIVFLLSAGCVLQTDGDDPAPPGHAQQAWVAEALPIFRADCLACHWQKFDEPPFLAGTTPDEIRISALTSDVVDLVVPEQSHVLTLGVHTGPALTAAETAKLLYWIRAEAEERQH